MSSLDGSSILITGGTGSFGQAFVRRILEKHNVKRLVVFSRDELKQFEMAQTVSHPSLRYFIGDVRDAGRLVRALDGIDTIVHAAAMKQVVAAEYNPIECIRTNIIGAENVINAAIDRGVKRVIALSTDKAVNPINLYGATKLCADKLFSAANHLAGKNGPKFSVVRYGNVIGSRGSVVPLFEKLRPTGKLPITDPRMTRFWLTLDRGVGFVETCLRIMRGGEVFVPKIQSVKVTDLAAAVAPECEIEVIGIRPGEKLHEVLIPEDDARHTLEFDDFFVIKPSLHLWSEQEVEVYDGKKGCALPEDFVYSSQNNPHWISGDELKQLLRVSAS
jgi:UDP-N-acetylglucosamine 4,6-dehydratase